MELHSFKNEDTSALLSGYKLADFILKDFNKLIGKYYSPKKLKSVLDKIVEGYTRENGVRGLENKSRSSEGSVRGT